MIHFRATTCQRPSAGFEIDQAFAHRQRIERIAPGVAAGQRQRAWRILLDGGDGSVSERRNAVERYDAASARAICAVSSQFEAALPNVKNAISCTTEHPDTTGKSSIAPATA